MASMRKGKWGRGRPCYGYEVDEQKFLTIKQEEAEVVKMIFEWVAEEGLSLSKVMNRLTERGIPTRGTSGGLTKAATAILKHPGRWHVSRIHSILTNEIYTGTLIQNRYFRDKKTNQQREYPQSEWIITKCPQIISEELFKKAHEQITRNKKMASRRTKK